MKTGNIEVILKVDEFVKKTGLSQKAFAKKVGIRPNTISEMCNNKKQRISMHHLEKIIKTYSIDDIRELITLETVSRDNENDYKKTKYFDIEQLESIKRDLMENKTLKYIYSKWGITSASLKLYLKNSNTSIEKLKEEVEKEKYKQET